MTVQCSNKKNKTCTSVYKNRIQIFIKKNWWFFEFMTFIMIIIIQLVECWNIKEILLKISPWPKVISTVGRGMCIKKNFCFFFHPFNLFYKKIDDENQFVNASKLLRDFQTLSNTMMFVSKENAISKSQSNWNHSRREIPCKIYGREQNLMTLLLFHCFI